jgi:hypothetical protein
MLGFLWFFAMSNGKPVSTPDRRPGHAFPDIALGGAQFAFAGNPLMPLVIALDEIAGFAVAVLIGTIRDDPIEAGGGGAKLLMGSKPDRLADRI